MARQTLYENDRSLQGLDRLTGIDFIDNSTKNFTIEDIAQFFASTGIADPSKLAFHYNRVQLTQTVLNRGEAKFFFSPDGEGFAFLTRIELHGTTTQGVELNSNITAFLENTILKLTNTSQPNAVDFGFYRVMGAPTISNGIVTINLILERNAAEGTFPATSVSLTPVGVAGADGQAGEGIASITFDADSDELVITFTDGRPALRVPIPNIAGQSIVRAEVTSIPNGSEITFFRGEIGSAPADQTPVTQTLTVLNGVDGMNGTNGIRGRSFFSTNRSLGDPSMSGTTDLSTLSPPIVGADFEPNDTIVDGNGNVWRVDAYNQNTGAGSVAFRFSVDGDMGMQGAQGRYDIEIFRREDPGPPSPPVGGVIDANGNLTTTPVGWSESIPTGTDQLWQSVFEFDPLSPTNTPIWSTVYQAGAQGPTGPAGRGIVSITPPTAPGLPGATDVYTINYSDGTTQMVSITNGNNGTNGTPGTSGTDGSSIRPVNQDLTGDTTATIPGTTYIVDDLLIDSEGGIYEITDASNAPIYTISFTGINITGEQGMMGNPGTNGLPGAAGRGITTIMRTSGDGSAGTVDTYTITFSDNTNPFSFDVTNGMDGSPGTNGTNGRGISTVARTSGDGSAGTVDTYTITFTDNTTFDYMITNGADGTGGGTATLMSLTDGDGISDFSYDGTAARSVSIDLQDQSGLSVDTNGLTVDLAATSGLELGTSGVGIELDTTSHDYLSLTADGLTLGEIDLSTDITGNLPRTSIDGVDAQVTANANNFLNQQGAFVTVTGGTGTTVIPVTDGSTDTDTTLTGLTIGTVDYNIPGAGGGGGGQGDQGIGINNIAAGVIPVGQPNAGDTMITINLVDPSGNTTPMPAIFRVQRGLQGNTGNTGNTGVGITDIARTSGDGSAGTVDTYTITYTNGGTDTFMVTNGADGGTGAAGRGITTIARTSGDGSQGTTDTYTVTFSDNLNPFMFTVTNGADGTNVQAHNDTAVTNQYISEIDVDANGAISISRVALPLASTSQAGLVQLGTASTEALAGNAVAANPGSGTQDLSTLTVNGVNYNIGGGNTPPAPTGAVVLGRATSNGFTDAHAAGSQTFTIDVPYTLHNGATLVNITIAGPGITGSLTLTGTSPIRSASITNNFTLDVPAVYTITANATDSNSDTITDTEHLTLQVTSVMQRRTFHYGAVDGATYSDTFNFNTLTSFPDDLGITDQGRVNPDGTSISITSTSGQRLIYVIDDAYPNLQVMPTGTTFNDRGTRVSSANTPAGWLIFITSRGGADTFDYNIAT